LYQRGSSISRTFNWHQVCPAYGHRASRPDY